MGDRVIVQKFKRWVIGNGFMGPYDFFSHDNCPYARFLRDTRRAKNPDVGGVSWTEKDNPKVREQFIPEEIQWALPQQPRTWQRLREWAISSEYSSPTGVKTVRR